MKDTNTTTRLAMMVSEMSDTAAEALRTLLLEFGAKEEQTGKHWRHRISRAEQGLEHGRCNVPDGSVPDVGEDMETERLLIAYQGGGLAVLLFQGELDRLRILPDSDPLFPLDGIAPFYLCFELGGEFAELCFHRPGAPCRFRLPAAG